MDDVRFLANHLGLRTTGEVLDIVTRYYPADRVAKKTQYFVEEIVQQLGKG